MATRRIEEKKKKNWGKKEANINRNNEAMKRRDRNTDRIKDNGRSRSGGRYRDRSTNIDQSRGRACRTAEETWITYKKGETENAKNRKGR